MSRHSTPGSIQCGRTLLCALALLLELSVGMRAIHAQAVDAGQWQSGSVDLVNGWREHDGDNLAWAQPGFDDNQWQTVELDNLGASEPKFRWYRLHVKMPHGHMHEHLLIVGGEGVYAAFVNGQPVADAQLKPWYAQKRPVEEIIPLDDSVDDFTLALRTHPSQMYALWHLPLFLTISVGSADAMDSERVSFESQRFYAAIPSIAINLLLVIAGFGAFALYRSQRGNREYIWLSAYLLLLGVSNGLLYCTSSGLFPLALNNFLADPLIYLVTVVQIEFTFRFAGRPVSKIWRAYEISLLAPLAVNALVAMGQVSTSAYVVFQAAMILPAALLLPVLLLIWYRKGNREAGWLIVPSLFPAATSALYDVGNASIFTGWGKLDFLANPIPVGPVLLQLSDLADFLFVLAIGVVMFFRFTRVSREQTRAAAELAAAREIQQRLVPAQLPRIAGYRIEAAYFPAQEVGGDFYQIFAQASGTQMLVVGDVSGKGLKAAMTGTLALGALRALATEGLSPAKVLMRLNRQLAQTAEDGFITCICARVTDSGAVTIANAGHLPPYKNGVEIAVVPGLPLGISADVEYEESTLQLGASDVLTFMTDGVVEARNGAGELFGFERTSGISRMSAEEIAGTAQRFGQEDDITVLTLARA